MSNSLFQLGQYQLLVISRGLSLMSRLKAEYGDVGAIVALNCKYTSMGSPFALAKGV